MKITSRTSVLAVPLVVLFFGALLTAFALWAYYRSQLRNDTQSITTYEAVVGEKTLLLEETDFKDGSKCTRVLASQMDGVYATTPGVACISRSASLALEESRPLTKAMHLSILVWVVLILVFGFLESVGFLDAYRRRNRHLS